MSVDRDTVKRVARLARIKVSEEEAEALRGELNAILGFVEQLNEVDVSGVEPMTSVTPMAMKKRPDEVTDGGKAAEIVANAPLTRGSLFPRAEGGGVMQMRLKRMARAALVAMALAAAADAGRRRRRISSPAPIRRSDAAARRPTRSRRRASSSI